MHHWRSPPPQVVQYCQQLLGNALHLSLIHPPPTLHQLLQCLTLGQLLQVTVTGR